MNDGLPFHAQPVRPDKRCQTCTDASGVYPMSVCPAGRLTCRHHENNTWIGRRDSCFECGATDVPRLDVS